MSLMLMLSSLFACALFYYNQPQMNTDLLNHIKKAASFLQGGGVIAYPTEAVYGLGCDPFNENAVQRLLNIKQRSLTKGLILIAAKWEHVQSLTEAIPEERMQAVLSTWPGPYTWIFPASVQAPMWITGNFDTIALRITDHPVAQQLCLAFGGPIVSTSANLSGKAPVTTANDLDTNVIKQLDYVLDASVGELKKPTLIRDVVTDKIIRL